MATRTYSATGRRGRCLRRSVIGILSVGWLVLSSCSRQDRIIPYRAGPLDLEIRFPGDGQPIAADSIPVWGTTGSGSARLSINGATQRVERNGAFALFVPVPPGDSIVMHFEAKLGDETRSRDVRLVRARGTPADVPRPSPWDRWVRLRRLPSEDTDSATQARPIFSRWSPGGRIALPLSQGLRLRAEARWRDQIRLELAPGLRVWISALDADSLVAARPKLQSGSALSVTTDGSETDVSLSLPEEAATQVDYTAGTLTWTLYGATVATPPTAAHAGAGIATGLKFVDRGPGRITIDIALADEPLGWKTEWQGDRQVLRIRDRSSLQAGLGSVRIGLDAGHPPLGTVGADGLVEDSMTLAVARAAADRLRAMGGQPVLIRNSPGPMSLEARPVAAERAGVDLFVSIHGNSPGIGRPPWAVDGTLVYWLQPTGFTLGRALLDEVSASLDGRPIGLIREDLAVLRTTWYPAVLVEGVGLIMPAREAALRTPAGVAAYADGIVAGIVRWIEAQASKQ